MVRYLLSCILIFLSLNTFAAHPVERPLREVCINTRVLYFESKSGIFLPQKHDNHSFVTIEDDGRIVHSTGFWDELRFESNIDRPYSANQWNRHDQLVNPYKRYSDNKYCIQIDQIGLDDLKLHGHGFVTKYGPYERYWNNCTKFAKYVFWKLTGMRIRLPADTPFLLEQYLNVLKAFNDDNAE